MFSSSRRVTFAPYLISFSYLIGGSSSIHTAFSAGNALPRFILSSCIASYFIPSCHRLSRHIMYCLTGSWHVFFLYFHFVLSHVMSYFVLSSHHVIPGRFSSCFILPCHIIFHISDLDLSYFICCVVSCLATWRPVISAFTSHVTAWLDRVFTCHDLSSCVTGFQQSWLPRQQRPGGRAGDPEETEAPDSRGPLVDVRLQPGVQAAVWRRLHVRSVRHTAGFVDIHTTPPVSTQHVSVSLQVRPLRGVRWFPDAAAGAVRPVAVS